MTVLPVLCSLKALYASGAWSIETTLSITKLGVALLALNQRPQHHIQQPWSHRSTSKGQSLEPRICNRERDHASLLRQERLTDRRLSSEIYARQRNATACTDDFDGLVDNVAFFGL